MSSRNYLGEVGWCCPHILRLVGVTRGPGREATVLSGGGRVGASWGSWGRRVA